MGKDEDPDEARRKASSRGKGVLIQAVKEGVATNEFVVELLVAQTLSAKKSGGLLAKKEEVDLLCRLAGTTQISEALMRAGAVKGRPFVLVLAGGGDEVSELGRGLASARRLERRKVLGEEELMRVEGAALLNVLKG